MGRGLPSMRSSKLSRQVFDELALLVENHHVSLDEFSVNAYNVIRRSWRRSLLLGLCGDGPRGKKTQRQT